MKHKAFARNTLIQDKAHHVVVKARRLPKIPKSIQQQRCPNFCKNNGICWENECTELRCALSRYCVFAESHAAISVSLFNVFHLEEWEFLSDDTLIGIWESRASSESTEISQTDSWPFQGVNRCTFLRWAQFNHSVTSRSKRMISSSACFSSPSITSSGRGGVYL